MTVQAVPRGNIDYDEIIEGCPWVAAVEARQANDQAVSDDEWNAWYSLVRVSNCRRERPAQELAVRLSKGKVEPAPTPPPPCAYIADITEGTFCSKCQYHGLIEAPDELSHNALCHAASITPFDVVLSRQKDEDLRLAAGLNPAQPVKLKTSNNDLPPIPTFEELCVAIRLTEKPPRPEYILEGMLQRGIVGMICAAGGTGKSFFLIQLAEAMADGKNFGPFKSTKPMNVLYLAGEDPANKLDERLWDLGHGSFPRGLLAYSVSGIMGPLMEFDGKGNPAKSKWYAWLKNIVSSIPGLDVLILDPKSRFYGLDEISNDHATQWVACLESLSIETGTTILFSHHVSKERSDTLTQAMSRGASALVDGVRFVLGMTAMNEKTAQAYNVEARNYIEMDIVKTNYSPKLPSTIFFKRGDDGLFEYASLTSERRDALAIRLIELIDERARNGIQFTRRDLMETKNVISATLRKEFPKFTQSKELDSLIDYCLSDGRLKTIPILGDGRQKGKMVLCTV